MTHQNAIGVALLLLVALAPAAGAEGQRGFKWFPVEGTGVHYLTTAVVHSQTPTDTGMIQRSTETVELDGDLVGRILYHPVSVFDFVDNRLTNTGNQVFSGTVLGSKPVLLHDDRFRFDIDLTTGETVGRVRLSHRIDGPRIRCRIDVVGTGQTPNGDVTVVYFGRCRMKVVS